MFQQQRTGTASDMGRPGTVLSSCTSSSCPPCSSNRGRVQLPIWVVRVQFCRPARRAVALHVPATEDGYSFRYGSSGYSSVVLHVEQLPSMFQQQRTGTASDMGRPGTVLSSCTSSSCHPC